jgi:hypothetical protein
MQVFVSNEQSEKDSATGYRHGFNSEQPDSRGIWDRAAYFEGYIKGSDQRHYVFSSEAEWVKVSVEAK